MNDALKISSTYGVFPNVQYLKAGGMDLFLDVYVPRKNIYLLSGEVKDNVKLLPVVVFFHGGGWVEGSKEGASLQLLPYLNKGWCVVNVGYRLGPVARAPAAIEDARSAAWWVKRNCAKYGFDPDRIVLTGQSAGGHLALMAGILPSAAGFDTYCPKLVKPGHLLSRSNASLPELEVAAIINWAGVTDVCDLITEPNMRGYALQWVGGRNDVQSFAHTLSPLSYIRKGLPPILTLHGDYDVVVPFEHASRLHHELDRCEVENSLFPIEGKEHFDFSLDDMSAAYHAIDDFLAKQEIAVDGNCEWGQ